MTQICAAARSPSFGRPVPPRLEGLQQTATVFGLQLAFPSLLSSAIEVRGLGGL